MFKNKTLLITGGTGSFGNAVMSCFLETAIQELLYYITKLPIDLVYS